MKVESTNDEASTNVLPFAKRMLYAVLFLKVNVDNFIGNMCNNNQNKYYLCETKEK